ncbi:MAG: gliding motility-associated C-terminal domain-containing protein [Parvicellaceae bacterium]
MVEPDSLILSGSSVSSTCGSANGEVSVVASGGTIAIDYSYSWFDISGGYPGVAVGTGSSLTSLPAGAYQVIVSDDNGCSDSTIVTLSDVTGPDLSYVSSNILCFGSANGSIDLTVVGSSPFNYNWIGPAPFVNPGTEDISGLEAGTYSVIVTDNNGCISVESIDLEGPSGAIQVADITSNLTCFNNSSGEININIIGGTSPYQTDWTGPNGFTSTNEDLVGLDSGQYVLNIIDFNGCPLSGLTYTLSQPDSIVIDTAILQPTCGLSDGAITVSVSGGTILTDYGYTWDDLSTPSQNISFSNVVSNVGAGNYQIQVVDDNGCEDSLVVSISDLTGPILSATTTDVDCVGDDDGTIDLSIVGSGSYLIDWDNDGVGDNDDNEDLIALDAGIYSVTVEDLVSGCIASLSENINVSNSISLSFLAINPICFADTLGSVDATVIGGTPNFSYDWTLNGFTVSSVEDPSGLAAGNYLLTVTDLNGCQFTDSVTITEPDEITLNGNTINSTCGNANGEVLVVPSGGTVSIDYTYSWFDISGGYPGSPIGSGNASETGLLSGSYHVIVADDNGCIDSLAVAVSDDNGPSIADSITNVLCFGDATGEIDLTISGVAPFSFSWSGPAGFVDPGTEDLSGIGAGTYSVVVTDANLCSSTSTFDVLSPSIGISVLSSVNDLLCNGDFSGSIDVLISGGTSPYLTNWSGPNGYSSINEDLSALDTGIYILDITDTNGCVLAGQAFTINQPDSILIAETIVLPTCNASDGEISVIVSGGTIFTDYTYNWDDISTPTFGLSSFSALNNIGAGNYELTVTDDNGCSNNAVFSITNVNAPTLTADQIDVDCNGNSTGEIDLTISGSSSYTIDWDNDGVGDNDDTEDLIGLPVGTYSVLINDLSTGCIATLSVNINEPGLLSLSGLATNLSCFGDSSGAIDLVVSGGSAPFSFDWDNDGVGDNDDSEDLTNLSSTSYSVIVTDSNLCSVSESFSLSQPSIIDISAIIADNLCYGDALGAIDLSVTGGVPGFSYQWTNSAGTQISVNEDVNNLSAGAYSLTVSDDSLCTKDSIFTVLSPNEIFLNVSITDANCAFDDGTATSSVVGGTLTNPDYIYDWDNDGVGDNDDASSLSLLAAGSYTLIAIDDNGCSSDTTITIGITAGPSILIDSINSVSCNNGNNGEIFTSIVGGTAPYNYIWNSGVTQQTDDIDNLQAGTYFLQVIDAIGCVSFDTLTVDEPSPIQAVFNTIDATCNACDGTANATVTGGTSATGSYDYVWSNGAVTNSAGNLCSGLYSLTVSDDANCSVTSFVGISDITGPTGELFTVTNPTCSGLNDGEITVSGVGGTGPYVFNWLHNGEVSNSISNIGEGVYFVEITDQSGCTRLGEAEVTAPSPISITETVFPADCGAPNGSIDLSVSGGSGGYSYLWSNSLASSSINNLNAGIYSVNVTDNNGCVTSESFMVSNFNSMDVTLTTADISCFNANDGSISGVVSGPSGTTVFNWYNATNFLIGNGVSSITNLSAGTYYLEVIDQSNGCIQYTSADINSPEDLILSLPNITPSSCDISCDGAATIVLAGENAPYLFNWSNGGSNIGEGSLCPGPSTVTITDINGCVYEQTVIIETNPSIDFQYITTDATCGACDGSATLSPIGGSGNLSVVWYDGLTGNLHSDLCSGVYGFVVEDANGCALDGSVNINNTLGPDNEVITTTDVSCFEGNDGSVAVIPSGGTPPYNYHWVPGGQTSNVLTNLTAGAYNLEVQDANGCIRVVEVVISEPEPFNVQSLIVDGDCASSDGSISLITTNVAAPSSVSWIGPNGFSSSGEYIINLSGGTYYGSITDANGCTQELPFSVNEIGADNVALSAVDPLCFGSCDGSISATPTGANYVYTWSDGSSSSSLTNVCQGTYGLDLLNTSTGCFSSSFATLEDPDSISLSIPFSTFASCNNTCDAQASVIPSGGVIDYSFSWSPASTFSATAQNLCAGIQLVTVTDANNCSNSQEVIIQQPDSISINIDFITDAYCVNNADGEIGITTLGGDGNYNYSWSTSPASSFTSSSEDLSNLLPTSYLLTIVDGNNCTYNDTILVDTSNVLIANAGLDSALCLNDCIVITGSATGTTNYSLVWLDTLGNVISLADTLEICSSTLSPSDFILQATDQNCISTDTVTILTNPLPVVDAGLDISEIYGQSVILGGSPTGPAGATVTWSPPVNFYSLDDTTLFNPSIEILSQQEYLVVVTDLNGCVSSDLVLVVPIPEIYYPSGFSPNGDGVNEEWQIDRIDEYPNCVVEIYNRWGEQLFRSIGYTDKWDGRYKNKDLPVGTYYYIIELNDPKFPTPYTGPVTIMR